MSKVKGFDYNEKRKAFRRLRRKETAHKKNKIIEVTTEGYARQYYDKNGVPHYIPRFYWVSLRDSHKRTRSRLRGFDRLHKCSSLYHRLSGVTYKKCYATPQRL